MVVREFRAKFKLSILVLMSVVMYAGSLLTVNGGAKVFAIVCPVDPNGVPITSGFGYRNLPGHSSNHDGLDLGADYGATVYAADSGTVSTVDNGSSGYGLEIDLDPDPNPAARNEPDKTYLYGHLSQINVADGQHVNAGDPIGLVGSTGSSTGAHLHFGENGDNPSADYDDCTPPGEEPATSVPTVDPSPAPAPDPTPAPLPPASQSMYEFCLSIWAPEKCEGLPGSPTVQQPSSYCPFDDHTEYCDLYGAAAPTTSGASRGNAGSIGGAGPDCLNDPSLDRCGGLGGGSDAPALSSNGGNVNTAYPLCDTQQFVYLGDGSGQCEDHLKNALRGEGYNPDQVANGVDAVQQFQFDNHVMNSGCNFSEGPQTCDGVVGPRTAEALNGDASCCSDGYHPLPALTSPYGGDYCDTHTDPGACSTQTPTYDESTFSYGGDYCDTHHDPGVCPTQAPIYDESTFSYGGDYCDTHQDPAACPTQDPNYGSTNLGTLNNYESSYTQTCEYTDHPEYCDTYGAGNGGEPGYEGSYEPTYNTPISAGPDCNNDPTLEYCQNNGITSNEPGYENSYETGYAGQCEYTDHPEYCDTYGAGNGGEPGYEGSYEPNYESSYESGYEPGYEGSYNSYCEYTDHPEYCE